ncbi:MAG: F0F1 ATP synthase subunit epsilon [Fidelibacterota bacterium]
MTRTFQLEIVTPTKALQEDAVTYLRCPGADGYFGVMAGHRPAMFSLSVGEIKLRKDKKELYFSIGGGFAEIDGDQVKLLVEAVERADEIDITRAEAALQRAKERIEKKLPGTDGLRAKAAVTRSLNRLRVAGK